MKVLIIDDSRTMRRLLASYLAPLASQTYEAGNGREALDVLEKEEAVDLALVDWDMPVMNGIDFVRVVRGDTRRSGIKLLMVTAHNNMESVTEAITAGADDFLMKPLTEEMVMDKLRMMGNRRLAANLLRPAMPKIRVLVVDDAVVMRRIISDVIGQDPELEVAAVAANGKIALQRIPQVNPDVVTLDVEMPEMDGVTTVRDTGSSIPNCRW